MALNNKAVSGFKQAILPLCEASVSNIELLAKNPHHGKNRCQHITVLKKQFELKKKKAKLLKKKAKVKRKKKRKATQKALGISQTNSRISSTDVSVITNDLTRKKKSIDFEAIAKSYVAFVASLSHIQEKIVVGVFPSSWQVSL